MSEKSLHEQIARGSEAARLLEKGSVLSQALDDAEKLIFQAFKEMRADNEAEIIACKRALRAQENLRQFLVQYINEGKAAQNTLLQAEDPTKPRRR